MLRMRRRSGGPKPRKRSGPLALSRVEHFAGANSLPGGALTVLVALSVVAVLGYLIAHAHVSAKHPFHRSQRVVFWNSLLGRHIAPHPDITRLLSTHERSVAA
jgi:hypothetical protein